jgi:N,N-dimethylformamidase
MQVIGYADRLSVQPDERIEVMVSSYAPRYRADVVRLLHGDEKPIGPGFKSEPVESAIAGERPGRVQKIRRGSYVRVPHDGRLALDGALTLQLWVRPTTPGKPLQSLISGPGYGLSLHDGRLELSVGEDALRLDVPVALNTWYFAAATYDAASGAARLTLQPVDATALGLGGTADGTLATGGPSGAADGAGDVLIAGEQIEEDGEQIVGNLYNGKLDAPRVFSRALGEDELARLAAGEDPTAIDGLVAAWDFSRDITSSAVTDASSSALHGQAVNMPMRGATGWNWTGRETAWTHAQDEYGAIHFHDDDLDDARWDVDFAWDVPADLPSGVYAFHLQALDADLPADAPEAEREDYVPFFVRPRTGRPTARIAFLAPTFSYLAYGNEHVLAPEEVRAMMAQAGMVDIETFRYPAAPQDVYIVDNELLSLYDIHSDGSGVCYSSRMRPVLNMRPKYDMAGLNHGEGSPHQFGADLCIVDWLHEHDYAFDVITDEDLHHDGLELLKPYDVVITGSHCEYWSEEMMDAGEAYLDGGGRMMYLGGNGMYWVTQLDRENGHTVEIRRRGPSTRVWEPAPGESHLSTTGELGGLWRYRGRAPQRWLGVGFTAVGSDKGKPYERQPQSFDPRAAFIFEGVGDDELIGDFPNLINGYGAAGFEIDRVDPALGTPHHTLLLATATGFSDVYQAASDDILISDSAQGGTVSPFVRADMVFLEHPNGGAVFSTGSIQWAGGLGIDGYDNNVSRVTRNVLERFLSEEPFPEPTVNTEEAANA